MHTVGESPAFGLFGACALFGGTSLYLAAHAAFWKRVGGTWKYGRLAGATVLLALIPVAALVPLLAALGLVVVVTALVVVAESVRFRR